MTPRARGLDVQSGGKGREESRTKGREEGQKSLIHLLSKHLWSVHSVQIWAFSSYPDFHLIWVTIDGRLVRP